MSVYRIIWRNQRFRIVLIVMSLLCRFQCAGAGCAAVGRSERCDENVALSY